MYSDSGLDPNLSGKVHIYYWGGDPQNVAKNTLGYSWLAGLSTVGSSFTDVSSPTGLLFPPCFVVRETWGLADDIVGFQYSQFCGK